MLGSQPLDLIDDVQRLRASTAVSWGAVLAGAAAAVAASVLLAALGAGLGLEAMAPLVRRGASVTAFAISGAIWLIVTQWVSAALGGYLAGRLRHRWLATHRHEVFFRDTAHGLVTWSVATLIVVGLSGLAFIAADGASERPSEENKYESARLLGEAASGGVEQLEAMHIAGSIASSGGITAEDRAELTSLVAARKAVSAAEAERRVDGFISRIKTTAHAAREAAAQTAIYTALGMLIGAFIASVAAALGGRLRDEHV